MTIHKLFTDDGGRSIDWGRTSQDYAEYRPDYPDRFYMELQTRGIGVPRQQILDLGTGVGFLAQRFASQGARVAGIDVAEGQIAIARQRALAAGLEIDYRVAPAESTGLEADRFDVVTASQCWMYFDQHRAIAEVHRLLKKERRLVICHLNWLPGESEIPRRSEELVLKYNPTWSGAHWNGEIYKQLPPGFVSRFEQLELLVFDTPVNFTRKSWRGRWRACRGVGASLSPEEIERFDREHAELLRKTTEERFTVLHRIDCRILEAS